MLKQIGALVVALIVMAIPILLACAFFYDWYPLLKILLIVLSVVELSCLWTSIYDEER